MSLSGLSIQKYLCTSIRRKYASRVISVNNLRSQRQQPFGSKLSTSFGSVEPSDKKSQHRKETRLPQDGLNLSHFIADASKRLLKPKIIPTCDESDTYLSKEDYSGENRKVKFVTFGCQMNVNDMETVRSILFSNGYLETDDERAADVILVMTCSIREGAEEKVWRLLRKLDRSRRKPQQKHQIIGVLGCMAERVRHKLLSNEKTTVDLVSGPDSYRDLPRLLAVTRTGNSAINVQLSLEETYADINPVRVNPSSKSAFVSIMRGCDNMCTYCIVPFTRGRERSRPIRSIVDEVRRLSDEGYKQVILLGQNVNSYRDQSEQSTYHSLSATDNDAGLVPGFKTVYKPRKGGLTFVTLLEQVAAINPELRIRFTSPHPKDFPVQVLELIKERANICKQIHLPAQSGSNRILEAMGRGYTREAYLALVDQIVDIVPDVSLTSDFIAGFCGETDRDHLQTLELIRHVKYSFCYVFPYSMRERTRAYHRLSDDVPLEIKQQRHLELAKVFREQSLILNKSLIGSVQLVLVESQSKRSQTALVGRADSGTKVVFEKCISQSDELSETEREAEIGDYVSVLIQEATSQTLIGKALRRTTLQEFHAEQQASSKINYCADSF